MTPTTMTMTMMVTVCIGALGVGVAISRTYISEVYDGDDDGNVNDVMITVFICVHVVEAPTPGLEGSCQKSDFR